MLDVKKGNVIVSWQKINLQNLEKKYSSLAKNAKSFKLLEEGFLERCSEIEKCNQKRLRSELEDNDFLDDKNILKKVSFRS